MRMPVQQVTHCNAPEDRMLRGSYRSIRQPRINILFKTNRAGSCRDPLTLTTTQKPTLTLSMGVCKLRCGPPSTRFSRAREAPWMSREHHQSVIPLMIQLAEELEVMRNCRQPDLTHKISMYLSITTPPHAPAFTPVDLWNVAVILAKAHLSEASHQRHQEDVAPTLVQTVYRALWDGDAVTRSAHSLLGRDQLSLLGLPSLRMFSFFEASR